MQATNKSKGDHRLLRKLADIPALTRDYLHESARALSGHLPGVRRKDLARFYLPWLKSMCFSQGALKDARPWITFSAARFIEGLVSRETRVFEYGAGGSTIFFVERVGELVTVEHDREWFETTDKALREESRVRWHGHLAQPGRGAAQATTAVSPLDPLHYASSDVRFEGMSFKEYASVIEQYEDNYFDLVLIDGRARPSCFMHAAAKVKLGGYIVLDNAEREQYAYVENAARKLGFEMQEFWGPGPYNRYFWRTLCLRRVQKYFALNELDKKLESYLDFDRGTFIEAGANDGVTQSNTLYFEAQRGWRGLLVEAIPEKAEECRRNRPHAVVEQAALVPAGSNLDHVILRYADLMSTIQGGMRTPEEEDAHIAAGCKVQNISTFDISVPTATLSDLIEKHQLGQIDLLVLDVEGYEIGALRGLDLTRHRPAHILVEARYRDDVHAYLVQLYDLIAELSHHDLLYALRTNASV